MSQFLKIAHGVDPQPVLIELQLAPALWDAHPARRLYDKTPHAAMRDIWVRYQPPAGIESLDAHRREHRNEFYSAWTALPALRPIVFGLMARTSAVELGSILITKLPPGAAIKVHNDCGSWAAHFYNLKAHFILCGQAKSTCLDETIVMQPGEVWTFDNLLDHGVENVGIDDRIAVIISMRIEP